MQAKKSKVLELVLLQRLVKYKLSTTRYKIQQVPPVPSRYPQIPSQITSPRIAVSRAPQASSARELFRETQRRGFINRSASLRRRGQGLEGYIVSLVINSKVMRSLETTEHISDYCDMSEPCAFRRRLAGALSSGSSVSTSTDVHFKPSWILASTSTSTSTVTASNIRYRESQI